MISQLRSIVAVFAPRNFDARYGDREVRRCAQGYLKRDGAELHRTHTGPELCQS